MAESTQLLRWGSGSRDVIATSGEQWQSVLNMSERGYNPMTLEGFGPIAPSSMTDRGNYMLGSFIDGSGLPFGTRIDPEPMYRTMSSGRDWNALPLPRFSTPDPDVKPFGDKVRDFLNKIGSPWIAGTQLDKPLPAAPSRSIMPAVLLGVAAIIGVAVVVRK